MKHGNTTHGMSSTRVYRVWEGILQRTGNPNHHAYMRYGGRGIGCEWSTFEEFFGDMGHPPSDRHSIERRNNNAGYSKSNCYWATAIQQANNKRNNEIIEFRGRRETLAEWGRITGLGHEIYSRIRRGWSIERAITQPRRKSPRK